MTSGARVERRHGSGPAGAALRREADILGHARHPGVADLLAVETDPDGDETWIDVAAPGGSTLESAGLRPEELAGAVAMVATTVADLHDIGVAHCDLSGAAVRVSSDGRAVLTHFHAARWIDGPPVKWPAHPLAQADDRAIGRMLGREVQLLGGPVVTPTGRSRARWRRTRAATPPPTLEALARLAGSAAGGRLSSRALAESLASEIVGARAPLVCRPDDDDDAGGPSEPEARMPRLAMSVGVLIGLAIAGVLVTTLRSHADVRGATALPSCAGTPSACPVYADGVLTVGSALYAVGSPGDIVAVGRWSCGAARLALLEPGSGTLWSYASWPTGSAPITPRRVLTLGPAHQLTVRAAGVCDRLIATTIGGARHDVTSAVAR